MNKNLNDMQEAFVGVICGIAMIGAIICTAGVVGLTVIKVLQWMWEMQW